MYILLIGFPPFDGPDDDCILRAIATYKYQTNSDSWNSISNAAKDLISKRLVPSKRRISAHDTLQHL
jgi:hypothetical protein